MSKKYAGATRSTRTQPPEPDHTIVPSRPAEANLPLVISREIQDEARQIIEQGFRSFADHSQRLAEDLTEFNRKREEMRGEIKRGARRTSGRIV